MNQYANMIRSLKTPRVMERLTRLYGARDGMLVSQITRLTMLLKRHEELVNTEGGVMLVSAPGRTEIGGNHTDHQRGRVLTAAVNLDTVAAVSPRADDVVRIFSEGYPPLTLSLAELEPRAAEKGQTAALVRGVAARMRELGYTLGGFDAVVTSTVRAGSGLSSSAAFEVMICAVFDALYNGWRMDKCERAEISQYAENVFFGKPSGLMDQMGSSVGGLCFIDFKEEKAKVAEVPYDFAAKGMALVVVNTGGSHGNLIDDYAAIPKEMGQVAGFFGEKVLRRVRPEQFRQSIPALREQVSDRAILRAAHFFDENARVVAEADALKRDDLETFCREIIASGQSSYMYLQNVYADPAQQQLSLALLMAQNRLAGKGAWRVHGGGFAGTTLNFVPQKELKGFLKEMESVFGTRSCNVLDVRPEGAACIDLRCAPEQESVED